ncbi:hypothetical protein EZI45_20915 [Delftia tsuruhatensis]|uniref:hypothetical protein n=1 Tax=Delftia tsuruhatensis TaxID=180282 RepID=UPI00105589E1|nr:hypothetical protein [Delftia tsuruhatensis]TDF24599.1 hypothetical protein EZI45_20915 [Delftia tsuruhatensis]
MEEKMHWLPTSIGMAVLACIFGGIAAAIFPGWEVIGGYIKNNIKIEINLDQNAPAWVQAVGSVLAIVAAIAVAWWQRYVALKQSHIESLRMAMVTAASVSISISTVSASLRAFKSASAKAENHDPREVLKLFLETTDTFVLPSDDQMLRLLPLQNSISEDIAKGIGHLLRAKYSCGIALGDNPVSKDLAKRMIDKCMIDIDATIERFAKARHLMEIAVGSLKL